MASGYLGEKIINTETSKYIKIRLYYSTSLSETGHNVYVELQLKRTNWYSGSTYQYPSQSYIKIDGNTYTWYWDYTNYPIIPAYNNDWHTFASRSYYVSHYDAQTIYLEGGNTSMGQYLNGSTGGNITLETTVSKPTGVTGTNLASENATEGQAYSRVNLSSWGTGASSSWWIVSKIAARGDEWTASQSTNTMSWNGLYESQSASSCAITTWYPEALNNYSLYEFGSAKYIASPSAPITSAQGSTSSPALTLSAYVNYSGGEENSSTCNSGTMRYWKLFYKKTSDSSYTRFTTDYTTSRSQTFSSISKNTFALGSNYNLLTRARNSLGGYSSTYQTVYCPTGVSGWVSNNTPNSFTFNVSATYPGTLSSSTGGSMAQYVIKYSTNKSTVDGGGGTTLPTLVSPTTSYTLTGLTPNTTYYYRVYGWNILGLSQVSGTLSNTTVPRYDPIANNLNLTSKNMGADVKVTIQRTGGTSANGSTISSVALYRKPASSSSWEKVGNTITGLSLTAGQSYTFTNAWTSALPSSGNYDVRVWISNGSESAYSPTYTITAPTNVSVARYRTNNDCPIQINANANASATNGIHHWRFTWKNGETSYRETTTASASLQVHSCNYLLYDTTYSYWATVYDKFGCWTNSSTVSTTTDKRFSWIAVVDGETKNTTPLFSHGTTLGATNYSIEDVYYIVKDSLGSKGLNVDLKNTKLTFITGTLNYRPESVASIVFTNGQTIAYKYVASSDIYQFGIWNSDGSAAQIFHNGNEWVVSSYDIPNTTGYVVAETHHTGKGMNASAPFSTTACYDKSEGSNG